MFFKRNSPKPDKTDVEHIFPHRPEPFLQRLRGRVRLFFADYAPLFEASCVAVSAHILAFPLIWFIGWALPWPKSPVITTVIEIDLSNWPEEAVPKKITDIYESAKYKKK